MDAFHCGRESLTLIRTLGIHLRWGCGGTVKSPGLAGLAGDAVPVSSGEGDLKTVSLGADFAPNSNGEELASSTTELPRVVA